MIVVVTAMAAEAEQAPETLMEENPSLWQRDYGWSQQPRENLLCFLSLSVLPLLGFGDRAVCHSGKFQLQLSSQKSRRGPWGPENVTVIIVKRQLQKQYHKVVYEHLGSFLSYRFIDLTLDSTPKALRTELWTRQPPRSQTGGHWGVDAWNIPE